MLSPRSVRREPFVEQLDHLVQLLFVGPGAVDDEFGNQFAIELVHVDVFPMLLMCARAAVPAIEYEAAPVNDDGER